MDIEKKNVNLLTIVSEKFRNQTKKYDFLYKFSKNKTLLSNII